MMRGAIWRSLPLACIWRRVSGLGFRGLGGMSNKGCSPYTPQVLKPFLGRGHWNSFLTSANGKAVLSSYDGHSVACLSSVLAE